ncbi:MAG: hypothetical protein [Caudoviricetes sp.]|nr:MAG: hypothetical protein [Caudoviricetes sp.]
MAKNPLWNTLGFFGKQLIQDLEDKHIEQNKVTKFDHETALSYLQEFQHQAMDAEKAFVILLQLVEDEEFDLNDSENREHFLEILWYTSLHNDLIMAHNEQNAMGVVISDTSIQEILDNAEPEEENEHPKKRD